MGESKVFITGIGISCLFMQCRYPSIEELNRDSAGLFELYRKFLIEGLSIGLNSDQGNQSRYSDAGTPACKAAKMAIEDSTGTNHRSQENSRWGVVLGAGCLNSIFPGQDEINPRFLESGLIEYRKICNQKKNLLNPTWLISNIINTPAEEISLINGIKGICYNITNHIDNGSIAFEHSIRMLRDERIDCVLTGGTEGCICADNIYNLKKSGFTAGDARHATPFSMRSDGAVISGGSAILALEKKPVISSKTRRQVCIAGCSIKYNPSSLGKSVNQLTTDFMDSMSVALAQASMNRDSIGFIQASASGIARMDLAEASAIKDLFKNSPPVTSCKGITGDTLGASGAMSIAFAALQIKNKIVMPIVKFDLLYHQHLVNYVLENPVKIEKTTCLVNSFDIWGNIMSSVLVY